MTRPKLPAHVRKDVHVSVRVTAEQAAYFRKWLAGDMSTLAFGVWEREAQRRELEYAVQDHIFTHNPNTDLETRRARLRELRDFAEIIRKGSLEE